MDLFAYTLIPLLKDIFLEDEPPRLRGIRLMELEEKGEDPDGNITMEVFNSFVGEKVIYIHTRCGACGDENDEYSNYVACGLKEWEEEHSDIVLASVDDDFDCTYRDTYIKVAEDKIEIYNELVEEFKEQFKE